mmetsp:Transcript_83260/g.162003  ORF Transcript_83260/g.162003 Transcript_83260/m.162003 type:complete len:207 (+) Transcript_83260:191-811(+)
MTCTRRCPSSTTVSQQCSQLCNRRTPSCGGFQPLPPTTSWTQCCASGQHNGERRPFSSRIFGSRGGTRPPPRLKSDAYQHCRDGHQLCERCWWTRSRPSAQDCARRRTARPRRGRTRPVVTSSPTIQTEIGHGCRGRLHGARHPRRIPCLAARRIHGPRWRLRHGVIRKPPWRPNGAAFRCVASDRLASSITRARQCPCPKRWSQW